MSRYVASRHVTFCNSQFIQKQEDTQWVLRNTIGEFSFFWNGLGGEGGGRFKWLGAAEGYVN